MMEAPTQLGQSCPDETPEAGSSTLAPLCSQAEFAELVAELVADEAPRLFAVVQEYGERVDGRIAAWGMALEDRTAIVRVDGGAAMSLRSPERAVRVFSRHPDITAHVVWVHPNATTPRNEIDPTITVAAQHDGAGYAAR